MGKPAARVSDMHTCPMMTPGVPPIPHVGGPIVGPGVATVLIGGMPAAVLGDKCVCVGPIDMIAMGSSGVLVGGMPAARLGDTCIHGGPIVSGDLTVLIGETGKGGVGLSCLPLEVLKSVRTLLPTKISLINQIVALKEASRDEAVLCEECQR